MFVDEGIGGPVASWPELDRCLAMLHSGDTLVVWRLDRLARSLRNLLELVEAVPVKGIHLRSLTESIDTSSASGRLVLSVFGALAEFDRSLIIERTQAGLASARAWGARLGRPTAMSSGQIEQARTLVGVGHRVGDAAQSLGVGRSALYHLLGEAN